MKIPKLPWLLPIFGLAMLVVRAWFDSPLAMWAIGVPFFLMLIAAAWLRRALPTSAVLQQSPKAFATASIGRRVIVGALVALLIAGFAYIAWSRIHDSGIVGWLDAVQARRDGKYSEKLSVMVATMYLLLAFAAGIGLILKFADRHSATPASPEALKTLRTATIAQSKNDLASQRRRLLLVMLAMGAATWLVGFGVHTYASMRHQEELHASYQPLDIRQVTSTVLSSPFIALRGRVHSNGYLSLKERTATSKLFLPLVAPDAPPTSPVRWVVQVDGTALPPLAPLVFAHATGEKLSQSTREAFERTGVPIASDAMLVDYVPTRGGQVVDRSAQDRSHFLSLASVVTASLALLLVISWVVLGLRQRRPGQI